MILQSAKPNKQQVSTQAMMFLKERNYQEPDIYYVLKDRSTGKYKSPYGQYTTVVLYRDLGTAKRNKGKRFDTVPVNVKEWMS